jgi:hypothetical protein
MIKKIIYLKAAFMLSINIIRIYFIQAVNCVVVASINNPLISEESLSIGKRKKPSLQLF